MTSISRDVLFSLKDQYVLIRTASNDDFTKKHALTSNVLENKIEKLPVVNDDDKLVGLITFRDITKLTLKPTRSHMWPEQG